MHASCKEGIARRDTTELVVLLQGFREANGVDATKVLQGQAPRVKLGALSKQSERAFRLRIHSSALAVALREKRSQRGKTTGAC